MGDFDLAELIEKEHAFEIITLIILYIAIFGFSTDFRGNNYIILSFFIIVPYVIFKTIAKDETVRDAIFRKKLIKFENSLKNEKIKEEYYEISEEAKKEIDKVDLKSSKSMEKFIINFLLLICSIFILLGNYIQIINFSSLYIQTFELKGQFLVVITVLLNLLNIYSSNKEISQLLIIYKNIYEKMG